MSPLLGDSAAMQRLRRQLGRVAPTPLSVLIQGETGTGKDLIAGQLHALSERPGELITVDCAGISAGVLESELFGHVRGAFTGATQDRDGLVVAAHQGTLFLDEVGELPPSTQTRLLRLIDTATVRPVGSDTTRKVDLRIVAATWQPLQIQVQQGVFRRDLYHRLDVISLTAPPLRDRRDDIDTLLDHFLEAEARSMNTAPVRLTGQARRSLRRWPWPGNVRELKNVARYLTAMTQGQADVADLPARLRTPIPALDDSASASIRTDLPYLEARRLWLDQFQVAYVRAILEEHGGNASAAARASGLDRRTIQRIRSRAAAKIIDPESMSTD